MKSYDIILMLKEKKNLQSDYAVAKMLKVSNTAINRYKNGKAMKPSVVMRACQILDIDAETTLSMIADQELQIAKDKNEKDVLNQCAGKLDFLLKRYLAAPLCIVLMIISGAVTNNTEAKTFKNTDLHNIQNTKLEIYFLYLSNAWNGLKIISAAFGVKICLLKLHAANANPRLKMPPQNSCFAPEAQRNRSVTKQKAHIVVGFVVINMERNIRALVRDCSFSFTNTNPKKIGQS